MKWSTESEEFLLPGHTVRLAADPQAALSEFLQTTYEAVRAAGWGPEDAGTAVTSEFVRDNAATAAVFGFFASAWFGWAQEKPPVGRNALVVGSIVSLLIAVAGGILTWQHWQDGTAFDEDTSRTFGLIVAIEFALAGAGALVLARRRKADIIPAWVALVVGVHLFPVAGLLGIPLIYVVAALVTLAALASVPIARSRAVAVSAVTGALVGSILLLAAVFFLAVVLL